MTHQMTPKTIEISKLVAHPANVRARDTESSDDESIAHLKASIAALGLIQPLLVQEIDGKFGVLAGKRRAAALKALAADKSVKAFNTKTKIDCRIVPKDCDVTTALSLAENITQERMNPIDEYEAFARMMEIDGQSIASIAMTFGTTETAVKGRLRFGLVHSDIRAAVRSKSITIDALQAFANHPSQEVQLEVYTALTKDGDRPHAHNIRTALKNRGVQVSDALGAFVFETYKERDGAIAADLLEEHSVLEDMQLIEEILRDKLMKAAEAERAALGFAWADAMLQHDYNLLGEHGRVYKSDIEPDEAGLARIDEIATEVEKLEAEISDDEITQEDYNAKYDQIESLTEEATELQEAYSPDDLAKSGVMASWLNGGIHLTRGLIRPEEKTTATSGSGASADGTVGGSGAEGKSGNAATTDAPVEIKYSGSLSDDLQTERAMAFGAALTQNPQTATDVAMFVLVTDVFTHSKITYVLDVKASSAYRSHAKIEETDPTSLNQVAEAHDALDLTWNEEGLSPAKKFERFRTLSFEEKSKLVAYALGTTTKPSFARSETSEPFLNAVEQEIMPDIRAHWSPNAAFFGRLTKPMLLHIIGTELGLAQEAVTLSGYKKQGIVEFLDQLFAEPFATLTDAQLEAVATWCPPHMQTPVPLEAQLDAEESPFGTGGEDGDEDGNPKPETETETEDQAADAEAAPEEIAA